MTRRKKSPSDRRHAVRAILARSHPHCELVTHAFRKKRRSAAAHVVGVDIGAVRRHATRWLARHGHAHKHLIGVPRREDTRDHDMEIVRLRVPAHKLKHAPHPPTVVVVSHAGRRVVAEQG